MRCAVLFALPAAACAAQLEVLTLLNWQRVPVGERAMGEGGAVVARVNGPASGYGNPAGLAALDRPTVSGSVQMIEYTRVASRAPGGTATADDLGLKPNLVGFANAMEGGGGWSFTLASPVSWSSGVEVNTTVPAGTRRDDGRSSLEVATAALAWGVPLAPGLNVGLALEGWLSDYRYDTGTSAHDATTVLTATYTEHGRQIDLRATLGMQWEVGQWRLGGLVRSPGVRLQGQGTISGSSTSGDGTTTIQSEIRNDRSDFDIPLPWQAQIGAAWMPPAIPGLEMEGDLDVHAGSNETDVLSAAYGTRTTFGGGPPVITQIRQDARQVDLRPVFNPRAGLRYLLPNPLFDRIVHVHLGGYIERSPVDSSQVFSQLDLLGATGGVSMEKGPMLMTVAGAYVTSGTLKDAIGFASSPSSGINPVLDNTGATYAVRTFTLIIGTSYRF